MPKRKQEERISEHGCMGSQDISVPAVGLLITNKKGDV